MSNIYKEYLKIMSTIKLILKVFIGQPVGLVIGIISPFFMIIILPPLFNSVANISANVNMKMTLEQIGPGLLLMPTLMIGLLGIPITLTTLKETFFLKKIRVLNITPLQFIFSFVIVFITIILLSNVASYLLQKIIYQNSAPNPKGASLLVPLIIITVSTIIIGITIGNIAKTAMTSFAIAISVFLPIMFLSGILFPQMDGWIEIFAKVTPLNHISNVFKSAWLYDNLNIRNYVAGGQNLNVEFFNSFLDTAWAYGYPLVLSLLQIIYNTFYFKWE